MWSSSRSRRATSHAIDGLLQVGFDEFVSTISVLVVHRDHLISCFSYHRQFCVNIMWLREVCQSIWDGSDENCPSYCVKFSLDGSFTFPSNNGRVGYTMHKRNEGPICRCSVSCWRSFSVCASVSQRKRGVCRWTVIRWRFSVIHKYIPACTLRLNWWWMNLIYA